MPDYTKHRLPRMGLSALFLESAEKTRTFNTMMFLTGNDCDSVRMLFKLLHDPRIQFHPDITGMDFVPYCPDNNRDMLYSHVFKVKPFLVGQGYDHMTPEKRRRLWQDYLNILSPEDADLMENFIKHKKPPETRLSIGLVKRYMPELLPVDDEDNSDPMILLPATPFNGIEWESNKKGYVAPEKPVEAAPVVKPVTTPKPTTKPVAKPAAAPVASPKPRGRPKKTT